jgi:hypothetical protein
MEENVDYVLYTPSLDSNWSFHISGKAKKISDEYIEILDIVKKIFIINEDFFIPTKIRYTVAVFNNDGPVNSTIIHPRTIKPSAVFARDIKSENGFSFNDFYNDVFSIQVPENSVKYIWMIEMEGKVKFFFKGHDLFIDENSPTYLYRHPRLDGPCGNPMTIRVKHSGLKVGNRYIDITDHAFYNIVYWAETDIWYENTEYGIKNKERLLNVFNKIKENYKVIDTYCDGSASALFDE